MHVKAHHWTTARELSTFLKEIPEVQLLPETISSKYFPSWAVYFKCVLNGCRKHSQLHYTFTAEFMSSPPFWTLFHRKARSVVLWYSCIHLTVCPGSFSHSGKEPDTTHNTLGVNDTCAPRAAWQSCRSSPGEACLTSHMAHTPRTWTPVIQVNLKIPCAHVYSALH